MSMRPPDDFEDSELPEWLRTLFSRESLFFQAGVVLAGLFALYLVFDLLRGAYTNWLWFSHLGLRSVYSTVLFTRVWLFIAGLALSGGALWLSYYAAFRYAWGESVFRFSLTTIQWIRLSLIVGAVAMGGFIAFTFASSLANRYGNFLLFMNAADFGMEDPQFHNDVGFYTFVLPVLHTIQGWLMGLALVTLVTTVGLYMLIFSARGINPVISTGARTQLALTGAWLMVTFAFAHFLDRYETLFSPVGAVTGTTYADVNARLPALLVLTVIALISAGIMLYAVRVANMRQSLRLIFAAFGLWLIAGIVAGIAWPALTQRLAVAPSELQRERPYVERNIEWTRRGFDLGRVDTRLHDVDEATLADGIAQSPETIRNIRLWDPRPLEAVLNQLQHLRLYYSFLDVDVDRYVVDGSYRQVLLGARELFQSGLDDAAQNWVNRTLIYTHGYGAVMSTATTFSESGQPDFIVRDVPPTGAFDISQPRVYYGEAYGIDEDEYVARLNLDEATADTVRAGIITNDAIIVNTNEPQFDRPSGKETGSPEFIERYDGKGGVPLSSLFRRAVYAWELLDVNILLSRQLTPESKVLYRRNIRERVSEVAPFLELDDDPYLVINDGRLYWIQDAFTTTDRFPYSRRIDGNRIGFNGDFRGFERPFNYIRNSVKVVIDAFDGAMDFYTIEIGGPDPVLQTYRNIFPDLFTPIEKMPPGLREHIRYPEELLRAQADTFLQYHMTDVKEFFLKEDEWEFAQEVVGTDVIGDDGRPLGPRNRTITPYYVIMKVPGEEAEEFVLILPFTPKDKPNLVGWMAARSDGPNYGESIVFEFPRERIFNGPSQIEARIDNDPVISEQFTLWNQSGSQVVRGNLLVIPIGETLLYAEPIYLQAESLAFPELKRVILATNTRVVMEPTLDQALTALLGGRETAVAPDGEAPGEDIGISRDELLRILDGIAQALESMQGGAQDLDDSVQALRDLIGESN